MAQNPYPTDGATRVCTYPDHEGENPMPFEDDTNFPLRKSGAKAGAAIGWCHACQKLSRERNKREPERQGTRPRVNPEQVAQVEAAYLGSPAYGTV